MLAASWAAPEGTAPEYDSERRDRASLTLTVTVAPSLPPGPPVTPSDVPGFGHTHSRRRHFSASGHLRADFPTESERQGPQISLCGFQEAT